MKKLFNLLPKKPLFDDYINESIQFQIQDIFQVDGFSIIGGLMISGTVRLNNTKLSPIICYLGPDRGNFIPVLIHSIRRQRCAVRYIRAGEAGTIALQFLTSKAYKKWKKEGKLVLDEDKKKKSQILNHDFLLL